MNFLSSMGLGGEFQTAVGSATERATSENLLSPDWGLNMQICDQINRRADGAVHAAKALKRRLKSDNPKVLQLTLTLCETVVKNCDRSLHQAVGTTEFLTEVANLSGGQKGYEVSSQALSLIQQWGIAFQSDRSLAYSEIYGRLQAQGAPFPPVEKSAAVFSPPAKPRGPTGIRGGEGRVTTPQTMEKLEADLQMVSDKITLCREMLQESPGVTKDDTLSEVVGFLEACQPRLVDLVEAGVSGSLPENTFNRCLQINVSLQRTLDAVRDGTPIPVKDGTKDAGKGVPNLLDLDGDSDDPLSKKISSFSIVEPDDESELVQLSNTEVLSAPGRDEAVTKSGAVPLKGTESDNAGSAITPSAVEDDLDGFLNSLEEASGSGAGTATGATATPGATVNDDELDKMLA